MVQNLPAATSDPPLRKAILPGCPHTCAFRLQTGCFEEAHHLRIELLIPIEEDEMIAGGFRECLPQLMDDPFCGGSEVTLQCRILRRWCSMTKKQYSIRNVTVGTVKKSKAAITSR